MTGKRICCCLVVFVLVLGADCRPPRSRPCGLRMVPERGVINARPRSHVSFICNATCLGELSRGQLLWKDPNENIVPSIGRHRIHTVTYNRWMVSRLMMRNVVTGDSGVYTCEVVHKGRTMRYTASLQVQVNPPPRRDDRPRRGDIYIEPEPDFGDIRPAREASRDPARRYRSRQGKIGPQRKIYPGEESGRGGEGEGEMRKAVFRARRQANNHSFPAGGPQNSSVNQGNASAVTLDPVTGDSAGFSAGISGTPPFPRSSRQGVMMMMMGPNITSPVPSPTPTLSTPKTSSSPKDRGSSSSSIPDPSSSAKPDPSSSAKLDSTTSAYASTISTTTDSYTFTTPITSPTPITTTQTSFPGLWSSTTTQTSSSGQRSSTTTQTSFLGERSSTTTQISSPGQRSSSSTGSSSSGSSSPGSTITTTAAGSVVGYGGASSSTRGSSSTEEEEKTGAKHSESKGGEEEGGETAFGRYGLVAFCLILVIALLLLAALLLILFLPRCCPHQRLFIFSWAPKDGDLDQDRPPKSTPNNQDSNVVLLGERPHRPLAPMTSATGLNGEFITPVDLDAKADEGEGEKASPGETGEKEVKKAEGGTGGDKPQESYVSTFLIGRLSSSKPAEDDPAPPMVAGNTGDTIMEDNVFGPATSTPLTQDKVKKEEDTSSSSSSDDDDDHRHGDSKDISSSDSFKDAASTGLDSEKVRSGQGDAEVKPKTLDNGGGVMAEVHLEINPAGGIRVENAHTDV